MNLLTEATTNGLGAALLPVAAALLFEELTCGGLARLLIAPWPRSLKHGGPDEESADEKTPKRFATTELDKQSTTKIEAPKGERK